MNKFKTPLVFDKDGFVFDSDNQIVSELSDLPTSMKLSIIRAVNAEQAHRNLCEALYNEDRNEVRFALEASVKALKGEV